MYSETYWHLSKHPSSQLSARGLITAVPTYHMTSQVKLALVHHLHRPSEFTYRAMLRRRRPRQETGVNGDQDSAVLIASPYLYLGPRSAGKPSSIHANGITHVLSIGTTPVSRVPSVIYHRISLSDSPSSSIGKASGEADTIIESAKSGKILVHCAAAVSRSPTILTAYLMKKCGMSLKDALGHVVRARPAVCPHPGFIGQLKELEITLRGECSLTVEALPAKKADRLAIFKI
jgi:atypical dual specificity phosphatase